jgi:hypothetical protein
MKTSKKEIIVIIVCAIFFIAAIAALPSIIKMENEQMKIENTK